MDEAKGKLGDRQLLKPTVVRDKGEGNAIISNFKIEMEVVNPEDYGKYDGVCEDGQHRTLALMFDELKDIQASYAPIVLPNNMDVLTYISLRNNGKKWKNEDYYASKISTKDERLDYIISKLDEGYISAFLFNIYTLGTSNITANQVKAIQQGYKSLKDFSKVQISADTQSKGDSILEALHKNEFLSKDRLSGRFGSGLKQFYNEVDKDITKIISVLEKIDKQIWDNNFTPTKGQSLEARSYKEAFHTVLRTLEDDKMKQF